jgi:DNA-binding NarL/FixJ family response regulator
MYLHRFAEARAHADRALRIGRATGQHQQFPLLFAIIGMTSLFLGRLSDAEEPLEGAIEAARLTGEAHSLAAALYPRARLLLTVGDVDLALRHAQEAFDAIDDGGPSHHTSHAAFALAEASLAIGRPERGVEALEATTGGPDAPRAATSFRAAFLELLVRSRLALGDVAGAERAAAAARQSTEGVGLPLVSAWADRADAEVALVKGDAARAAELALAAVAAAETAGAPLEAALGRTLAGRALAAAGERARARELLEHAAAESERCGALRLRDAAERELRRLGHRIHRRSQTAAAPGAEGGVGSLTPRELEIARCIVDRQTNRQIAEALFLSPKTVETHVRNIFGKLGAGSRVDVARIVEQADRQAATAP